MIIRGFAKDRHGGIYGKAHSYHLELEIRRLLRVSEVVAIDVEHVYENALFVPRSKTD